MPNPQKIAIYPGSFDPVTYGHLDVAKRAANLFDKVIVVVMANPGKSTMFTPEERMALIAESVKGCPNIETDTFSGLMIEYFRQKNASAVVKGLRAVTDFDYEMQLAYANKEQNHDAETIFLPTSMKYSYLSSSMVKGFAMHGGKISDYVPAHVEAAVWEKFKKR